MDGVRSTAIGGRGCDGAALSSDRVRFQHRGGIVMVGRHEENELVRYARMHDRAINRRDLLRALGATGADYALAEAVTVEEAIALYTRAGAYASFDEDRKGTITVGKLADFAILANDPRSVLPDEIDTIPVLGTMSGGRLVYEAPIAATAG
jgi:predicted amidohydrolase YtcJ